MMRRLVLLSMICCTLYSVSAKAKRNRDIQLLQSYYTDLATTPRKAGFIYEFEVKALRKNIVIDSIWLGATPVPCDVINKSTTNRDLYKLYPDRYDSLQAAKNFHPPMSFQGVAIICYTVNSKRKYFVVKTVKAKAAKGTRGE
jgi:hypothetical protein